MSKIMLPQDAEAVAAQLVIDKYTEDSTKSGARKIRGESNSIKLNVIGFGQAMFLSTNE